MPPSNSNLLVSNSWLGELSTALPLIISSTPPSGASNQPEQVRLTSYLSRSVSSHPVSSNRSHAQYTFENNSHILQSRGCSPCRWRRVWRCRSSSRCRSSYGWALGKISDFKAPLPLLPISAERFWVGIPCDVAILLLSAPLAVENFVLKPILVNRALTTDLEGRKARISLSKKEHVPLSRLKFPTLRESQDCAWLETNQVDAAFVQQVCLGFPYLRNNLQLA